MARLKCQKCGGVFDGRSDAKYCGGVCRANAAKERRQSRNQPQSRRSTALTSGLTKALKAGEQEPVDAAAVALARFLARQLDASPASAEKLAPRYLDVLSHLRMTPKARGSGTVSNDDDRSPRDAKIDQLRERRERRRANGATAMDSPAT